MGRNILIVDDELVQAKMLGKLVKDMNHNIMVMNDGQEVVDFFLKKKNNINNLMPYEIDVMLLDLSMPKLSGIEVLKQISAVKGDLQIIVLTASNDVSLAINAINLGAVDYIVKGEKDVFARVVASINNAVEKRNLKYQVYNLERQNKDKVIFSDIIGSDPKLMEVINLAKKAVNSTVPVFIEGPSGSGKELLARAIHGSGPKSGKPFVEVDCSNINSTNVAKDLFGYEKKVQDGSVKRYTGKLMEANDGTLFLKNVGDLDPDSQVRLLRFLQEGQFQPDGSSSILNSKVRVIASHSGDIQSLVLTKRFREDLLYRLNIFPVKMPALVERDPKDVQMLAESFCYNASVNENKKIKGINDDALKLLISYDWEDNVRQLKNYVFRAVVLCDDDFLKPIHFPQIMMLDNQAVSVSRLSSVINRSRRNDGELFNIFDDEGNCKTLEQIESEIFKRLHQIYGGNLSEISKRLKVSRSTVYRKLDLMKSAKSNDLDS